MITLFHNIVLFKKSPGRHFLILFRHPVKLQGTVGDDQVDGLLGIKGIGKRRKQSVICFTVGLSLPLEKILSYSQLKSSGSAGESSRGQCLKTTIG
jgi:hypothetical protein